MHVAIDRTANIHLIVTGGARGIGAATARLMAESGAKVLITDVLDDQGTRLARELGPNVHYCSLDVTKTLAWENALLKAEQLLGQVDCLFNNAGVLGLGSVLECSPEAFRKIIEINLTGIFLGIRTIAPALKRAGGGMIVNTSSTAGLQGYGGLAAYVASKWGVRGLTKAAALDLAADNIRVVSVHPGPIRTPMTKDMSDDVTISQPIPRFGEAIEVARLVKFLLTEATYSTGSEFVVDGGAIAGQVLPIDSRD